MPFTYVPLRERIERKISRDPSGCWLWLGGLSNGYGCMTAGWQYEPKPRRTTLVYRLLYEEKYGLVPIGLELDHKCRVRRCVNPDHLEPVTRRENIRRGVSPVAREMQQTHCLRGHPFDAANTYIYKVKYGFARQCRACRTLNRKRKA